MPKDKIRLTWKVAFSFLFACALFPAAAEVPFCALRFGYRFPQPDKWPEMRAALEKNRQACVDEVWFSTGVSFPSLAWHEEHARQCAKAADDLRKLGIIPSIELQTIIGHTDDIVGSGDCSGQDWGTMVSADGLAAKHVSCPRDPKLIAYFVRVSELHAAWKPGSVWVDDDMSYRNRAPVRKPGNRLAGCFCDTCIAGFSRAEGKTWERAALAQAIRSDAAMRKRWDDYSCAGMGELTRAIAAAVHRISPQTVMGYQYGSQLQPAIPRGLYDGSGHPVRLRPGALAYWDTDPYDQLDKAYLLQTKLHGVHGEKWIEACCPEIESCPRTFACRTAQGIILEAFENLALGMDFLSMFVADARTDETAEFYADGLFPRLAEAHAFLQGYHAANGGTHPCGFSRADCQRDGAFTGTFAGYRLDPRAHGGLWRGQCAFAPLSDTRHADRFFDGIDEFLRAVRPRRRREDADHVRIGCAGVCDAARTRRRVARDGCDRERLDRPTGAGDGLPERRPGRREGGGLASAGGR